MKFVNTTRIGFKQDKGTMLPESCVTQCSDVLFFFSLPSSPAPNLSFFPSLPSHLLACSSPLILLLHQPSLLTMQLQGPELKVRKATQQMAGTWSLHTLDQLERQEQIFLVRSLLITPEQPQQETLVARLDVNNRLPI